MPYVNGAAVSHIDEPRRSTTDRLLDMIERQTEATESMGDRVVAELRDVRSDLKGVGERIEGLGKEVGELRAIPRLVTLLTLGMLATVLLVGIAASAHVAIDAGWIRLEADPRQPGDLQSIAGPIEPEETP